MTGQPPARAGFGDSELDAVLDSAITGIVARLQASLDHEAGLADVSARRRALYPRRHPPALARDDPSPHEPQGRQDASRALQQVCDHIDNLDKSLAAIVSSAGTRPFPGMTFLDLARPVLMQLRSGLANKALARADAESLAGTVRQYLDRADQVLQAQHATTLEQAVRHHAGSTEHETIAGQVRSLQDQIARLYASASSGSTLVPAT